MNSDILKYTYIDMIFQKESDQLQDILWSLITSYFLMVTGHQTSIWFQ
jgi:hypothetical protein